MYLIKNTKYIISLMVVLAGITLAVSGIAANLGEGSLGDLHTELGIECLDCHSDPVNAYQNVGKLCTTCHGAPFPEETGCLYTPAGEQDCAKCHKSHNVDYVKK